MSVEATSMGEPTFFRRKPRTGYSVRSSGFACRNVLRLSCRTARRTAAVFGAGKDKLNARDGVRGNDAADGGPGKDSCTANKRDSKLSC